MTAHGVNVETAEKAREISRDEREQMLREDEDNRYPGTSWGVDEETLEEYGLK